MKIPSLNACWMTLLVALLSSCNFSPQESPLPPQPVLAQIAGNNAWDCESTGEQHTFALKSSTPGQVGGPVIPSAVAYYVYLDETPPYELGKNCMCKLQHYTFEFDFLPLASQISLNSINGISIPFSGPSSTANGTQEITISKAFLQSEVLIEFHPGINPKPDLLEAGGICIVDNISAPLATVEPVYFQAFRQVAYNPELEEEYYEYFLPSSILSPVVP